MQKRLNSFQTAFSHEKNLILNLISTKKCRMPVEKVLRKKKVLKKPPASVNVDMVLLSLLMFGINMSL